MLNKKQISFNSGVLQIHDAQQESIIINFVNYDVVCEQAVKEFLLQVIELYFFYVFIMFLAFFYVFIMFLAKDFLSDVKKGLRW
jgi:preprotein translocase subunit SecY